MEKKPSVPDSTPKTVWVLCEKIGFGKLIESSDGSCKVELEWGTCFVFDNVVHKEIKFVIHTYHKKSLSKRPGPLELVMNLSQPLTTLKDKIAQYYDLKRDELRLVCYGRELQGDASRPLAVFPLRPEATLTIFLVVDDKAKFFFSPSSHPNLKVCDEKMSIEVVPSSSNEVDMAIRGDQEISEGKVYWDVRIDRCASGRVNLGVCVDPCDMSQYIGNTAHGWSYYGSTGKSEHRGNSNNFGPSYTSGDVIRVKLDMNAKTLAYEKNTKDLGIAHRSLPAKVWPAFSLFSKNDKITLTGFGTF